MSRALLIGSEIAHSFRVNTRNATTAPVAERILAIAGAARDVPGGIRHDLELVHEDERVPAILTFPQGSTPVPAVLMLHGLGSTKERMAETVGAALVQRGVAALAVDLPMHGAREGGGELRRGDALALLRMWKTAIAEARVALEYLRAHQQVSRRLGIVGYSLGSFIGNVVASSNREVQAIVLAASGDLPAGLPFETLVRSVLDPLRAVKHTGTRPLLMINGRYDRTVTPAQAERLFAAALEPKTMRWYGGGHWPPPSEIDFAAGWLADQLLARN